MKRINLVGVTYSYPGSERIVLKDVTTSIETGELVALYGPNGAGKSTLLRLVAGLIEPSSGSVEGVPAEDWNRIALVMQEPASQIICGSVREELAWGLQNLLVPADEIERRTTEALQRFNLEEVADRPPESLSDGGQQLLAIASALIMDPDFILFDEAPAFLDPYWRRRIWDEAQRARVSAGVIWSAARRKDARNCDRIWWIDKGALVELRPNDI